MLLFLFAGSTALFFDGFQVCDEGVVVAADCFTATKLPMQFELVAFDVFITLTVVTVKPYVDHLTRVVLILHESYLALGLR